MGTNREQDKAEVLALGHEQKCYVYWFSEGGGEVFRLWDTLVLFEIPQYGGEGRFAGAYHMSEVDSLLDKAYSWT